MGGSQLVLLIPGLSGRFQGQKKEDRFLFFPNPRQIGDEKGYPP